MSSSRPVSSDRFWVSDDVIFSLEKGNSILEGLRMDLVVFEEEGVKQLSPLKDYKSNTCVV